jgi:hypothetical protein
VGRIIGLEVVAREESSKIYSTYQKKGWLKEMERQLGSVGANVEEFSRAVQPESFAVIKYRPESLDLLDVPLEFATNDPAIKANYYVLLNQKQQPRLFSRTGKFSFVPGHSQKRAAAKSSYEAHSGDIDLVHNTIQTAIYRQLIKTYGRKNVGTELDAGNGSKIDVVVHDNDGRFIFFEIKTSYSVRLCLREAVGQLLEYAYFPEKANAKKLIVVSPNRITPETRAYIRKVRSLFGIPLYYQRYAPEKEALEETMD